MRQDTGLGAGRGDRSRPYRERAGMPGLDHHVGRVICVRDIRLSSDIWGYLPEYRQRRKDLLCWQPMQQVYRYRESVLSTWEASFDAVATQNPAAARLLGVLASMSFDDIFLRIFDRIVGQDDIINPK